MTVEASAAEWRLNVHLPVESAKELIPIMKGFRLQWTASNAWTEAGAANATGMKM